MVGAVGVGPREVVLVGEPPGGVVEEVGTVVEEVAPPGRHWE